MKKIIKWGLIGFVGLIVLGVILGSSGNDKSTPSGSKEAPQSDSTTPQVEAMKVDIQEFIAEFDKNQLAAE